jgi:hypothetical protein
LELAFRGLNISTPLLENNSLFKGDGALLKTHLNAVHDILSEEGSDPPQISLISFRPVLGAMTGLVRTHQKDLLVLDEDVSEVWYNLPPSKSRRYRI